MDPRKKLTASEKRIADLVADGWTNGEISNIIQLSYKTVTSYVTEVRKKLDLQNYKFVGGRWVNWCTRRQLADKLMNIGFGGDEG